MESPNLEGTRLCHSRKDCSPSSPRHESVTYSLRVCVSHGHFPRYSFHSHLPVVRQWHDGKWHGGHFSLVNRKYKTVPPQQLSWILKEQQPYTPIILFSEFWVKHITCLIIPEPESWLYCLGLSTPLPVTPVIVCIELKTLYCWFYFFWLCSFFLFFFTMICTLKLVGRWWVVNFLNTGR